MRALWTKWRRELLYLLFGGLTTLLNIAAYWLLTRPLALEELWANAGAWVISVAFAYIANKRWVFQSKTAAPGELVGELLSFVAARLFSGGLDMALMWIFVLALGWPDLPVKIAVNLLVIALNYLLSRWWIFKKGGNTP